MAKHLSGMKGFRVAEASAVLAEEGAHSVQERVRLTGKRTLGRSRFVGGCLLAVLSALALSGCGKPLKNAYDAETAKLRMSSVNVQTHSAKGFAADLSVPGTTSFNADEISAEACLLVPVGQESTEAIAYKNPYVRTYQASITKVLTALVCLENVDDLSQTFTVTENSRITESGSSSAWIRPGETLTIEQLLYGMLLPSGNDAAVAVAEATSGSVEAFVEKMNETANRLGATQSHFVNPSGLHDDDHYSTPYDIYLILRAAMENETFRTIVGSTSYFADYKDKNGSRKTQTWKGSNQFMNGEVETPEGLRVLGGKTGTTKRAGYCLTMDTEKTADGSEYISVVMKAEDRTALYADMTDLLTKIR